MKVPTIALISLLLPCPVQARLFGNKGKQPLRAKKHYEAVKPDNQEKEKLHEALNDEKSKASGGHADKKNGQALTIPDIRRNTNQVRVTLTDVDDVNSLSPAETIFFEDSFKSAFVQIQKSNDDDVQVRSMIVLPDVPSKDQNRALFGTPGQYFDISALFEWSCRLCGSTTGDDDYTNDDFYFNGVTTTSSPTSSPTESPSLSPTYHMLLDDPPGPVLDDDWALGSTLADDDLYSFFFGKRVLEESDERRLEDLLCNNLRAGPFPAFHRVTECFVLFTA